MRAAHPLPRTLVPHPDEALAGYLLNLSARLRDTPARLATRLGLADDEQIGAHLSGSYAVRLPRQRAERMAAAARLPIEQVNAMTLARWDGTVLADGVAARTEHGRAWVVPVQTRACPGCLPRPASPDGGDGTSRYALWKTAWRTPWAFACIAHQRLLIDRCPSCTTLLGLGRGDRRLGLVPTAATARLHPAACRALTRAGKPCGHRLDLETAPAGRPDEAVLASQQRLDTLLASPTTSQRSLGATITGDQWLRDLRLLAVALRIAPVHDWPVTPPSGTESVVAHDQQARADRRVAGKAAGARDDRTWTEPPTDSAVTAALITTAMALLDTDAPGDGRDLVAPVVTAASTIEPLLWNRIRSAGGPSARLARWTSPGHGGTFSTHVLAQAAGATRFQAGADQVPQWATPEQDAVVAPLASTASERDRRRATSLALVRLLDGVTLLEAAELLGIPVSSAETAVARTGRALRDAGTDDDFREAVAAFAASLTGDSTNYGALRRAFGAEGWTLPDDTWRRMRQEMTSARLGRRDTDWGRRRVACSIWLWARLTGGDPALAPLAAAVSTTGRACTAGRMADVSAIQRHAGLTAYLNSAAISAALTPN